MVTEDASDKENWTLAAVHEYLANRRNSSVESGRGHKNRYRVQAKDQRGGCGSGKLPKGHFWLLSAPL